MIGFLRQAAAILVIAYKRLTTQRSLAIATAIGLTTAVALVVSVPLYAEATQFRLLRQQLVDGRGAADYAPLTLVFHYSGAKNGPQWTDAQPADEYLAQSAGTELGLPVTQLLRRFRTDSLQIFPPLDPNNPQTKYYITWAHFGFVNAPQQNIRVVAGTLPSPADASPTAPVEVMVHEELAKRLVIQPGDVFYARRDKVEIPLRVVGLWAPIDPALPVWDFKSEETLMIPEETYATRIADTLPDELTNVEWLLQLSGSRLQASDIGDLLTRIDRVSNHAIDLLSMLRLTTSPVTELANYQDEVPALTLLLFAFSAPLLGLVLVFVGLVAGLFVNQQRNEIAILRSRGATLIQVASMTLLQGLTLGSAALIVGIPIGVWITHLIGRSRSFMDFSTPDNLRVILTPPVVGFGISAILAVLIFQFIAPTVSAARNTIITYKQERARSIQRPWWQRVWLDGLLLLTAAYGAYALSNQRELVSADKLLVPDPLRNPQLVLVPSLGIFALTLLVLRVMPSIMGVIARLLARTRSVGLLTAARYLARTPAFYNAPLILLVFTLSLSTYTASIAQTLDRHLTKQTYYATGADISLSDFGNTYNADDNLSPAYTFAPIEDYARLNGVHAVTRVGRYEASVARADSTQQDAQFLGIDRVTFPQVAYWQPDFSPARLGALMNALGQYPDGVLMSRELLTELGLKLGDTLTISVKGARWSVGLKVIIVGLIDLFPTWYPENGPLIVGNLDTVYREANSEYPHETWLKTAPDREPADIVYAVRGYTIVIDRQADQTRLVPDGLNTFIKDWTSATQTIIDEQRKPERQGLFGLLSVGFVTAALLTVLGFILYALFSFRRRFIELGMLRAVGLSARQMTALLASELVFLIAIGLIVGSALGILFSQWFIPYLQVGASLTAHYPPFAVEIAWPSLLGMYAVFGLLFVGALSGLAALLLRMKIFQAIKLGETT